MSNYCIYKHTSPSGKSYIGQTKDYEIRCTQHKWKTNKCLLFSNAIRKYGWGNFTHKILEKNLTIEEANEREVFYIETLNTLAPNGYNLRVGGDNKRFSLKTI